MITIEILKDEMKLYKNTLVIDYLFNIVRLVDVENDEDDFYWVFDTGNSIYKSSCVGGWVPLKGHIIQKEYDRMIRIWNLHSIDKAI